MRKPDFSICENKAADQFRRNCEADHAFVFVTLIVKFLLYLHPKFQDSIFLLRLYRSVCVAPDRNSLDSFSRIAAHYAICL